MVPPTVGFTLLHQLATKERSHICSQADVIGGTRGSLLNQDEPLQIQLSLKSVPATETEPPIFTSVRTRKQSKWPSVREWLMEIYTVELHTAVNTTEAVRLAVK